MSEEKDDDEKIEQSSDPWSSFEAEEREDSPKENLDFLDALSEELSDSAVPDGVDGFADLSPSDASHLMSSESRVDDDAPSAQIEQGGGTGSETTHDSDDDVADWLSEQAVDGFDTGAENDTVEGSEETGEAVGHSNGQTDVEATEAVGETSVSMMRIEKKLCHHLKTKNMVLRVPKKPETASQIRRSHQKMLMKQRPLLAGWMHQQMTQRLINNRWTLIWLMAKGVCRLEKIVVKLEMDLLPTR